MGCKNSKNQDVIRPKKNLVIQNAVTIGTDQTQNNSVLSQKNPKIRPTEKKSSELKQSERKKLKYVFVDVEFQVFSLETQEHEVDLKSRRDNIFKQLETKDPLKSLQSLLPKAIQESLFEIQQSFEANKVEIAVQALQKICSILKQPENYATSVPINLFVEKMVDDFLQKGENQTNFCQTPKFLPTTRKHTFFSVTNKVQKEAIVQRYQDEKIENIPKMFTNRFVKAKAPLEDFIPEKVTHRQINQWNRLNKGFQDQENQYIMNAQAITSLFILNGCQKMRVFVHQENIQYVVQFLKLSIDLGGFPLIEPVYDIFQLQSDLVKDLHYLLTLQEELITHNLNGYRSNLLHILAEQTSLSDQQKQSLKTYLQKDSFQRINIWQPDYKSEKPLTIAFLNRNTDFILELLQNETSQSVEFWTLLSYHQANQHRNPLIEFFSPLSLDFFQKKRACNHVSLQLKVFRAIRDHFKNRKDLENMLKDILETNQILLKGLGKYANCSQRIQAIKLMQNVYIDQEDEYLLLQFPKFEVSQKQLLDLLNSQQVQAMPIVEKLMIAIFGSAMHQFGLPVIQMAAFLSGTELRQFAVDCPGLDFLLKNQVTPIFQTQTNVIPFQRIAVDFPLFHKSQGKKTDKYAKRIQSCYCSSLKLARLFNPNQTEIHKEFVQCINLSLIPKIHSLEFTVLIGETVGDRCKQFTDLFETQPWLTYENIKEGLLSKNDTEIHHQIKRNSTRDKFEKLLLRLGTILIQNQNHVMFGEFLLSLSAYYLNSNLVNQFLKQCRIYFNLKCFVPIFAICSNQYILTIDELCSEISIGDHFIDKKYQKDHLKALTVSQEEIDTSLRVWNTLLKQNKKKQESRSYWLANQNEPKVKNKRKYFLEYEEFFIAVNDGPLADELVNFIIEKNLIGFHLGEIDGAGLWDFFRRQESNDQSESYLTLGLPILKRFNFYKLIFRHCSLQTVKKFFQAEFNSRIKYSFSSGLFPLYILSTIRLCGNQSDQTDPMVSKLLKETKKAKETYRRKAAQIFPKILEAVDSFPQQIKLLEQSQSDSKLESHLAERIGLTIKDFKTQVTAFLTRIKKKKVTQYSFSEIQTVPLLFPIIQDEQKTSIPKAVLKISQKVTRLRDNKIQQTVFDLKFEIIFDMLEIIISKADYNQLSIFLFWLDSKFEIENKAYTKICEIVFSSFWNIKDESFMKQKCPSFFLRKSQTLFLIIKRLFNMQKHEMIEFVEQYESVTLKYNEETEKFLKKFRPLLKSYQILTNLVDDMKEHFKTHQGNQYIRKGIIELQNKIDDLIGDDLGTLIEMDIILTQSFKKHSDSENEPSQEDDGEEVKNKGLENFFSQQKIYDQTMLEYQMIGYKQYTSEDKKYSVFAFENDYVNFWKEFNRNQVAYVVKNFEKIIQSIQKFDTIELKRDISFVCLAYWFEFMTPEQIQTVLKMQTNWFAQIKYHQISLTIFLQRNDLSAQILNQIIEKAALGELEHTFPRIDGAVIETEVQEESTASKILHLLIQTRVLFGKLKFQDLPQVVREASNVNHLIRAISLGKIACQSDEKHLELIKCLTEKVESSLEVNARCAKIFTFIGTFQSKNKKTFSFLHNWIQENNPDHISSLDLELKNDEDDENKGELLQWILMTSRFELILQVKKMSDKDTWKNLVNYRTKAYSSSTLLMPCMELQEKDNDDRVVEVSEVDEDKEQLIEQLELDQFIMKPFFIALSLNQFELAEILMPENFSEMSICEYNMLNYKLKTGVNPLTLGSTENQTKIEKLQKWLSLADQELRAQNFGALELLALMPNVAVQLIRAVQEQEDGIFQKTVQLFELKNQNEESLKKLTDFFSQKPVYSQLVKEASQDAHVLKFFVDSGIFLSDSSQSITQALKIKLSQPHINSQNFIVDLIMAFPFAEAQDKNKLLKGDLSLANLFSRSVRDTNDLSGGGLTQIIKCQKYESDFDQNNAFQELIQTFSINFLQDKSYIDFSMLSTFQSLESDINKDDGIGPDDEDEDFYFNKIEQIDKLSKDITSITIIDNVFSMQARRIEKLVLFIRSRIDSSDQQYFNRPRDTWSYGEDKFINKTTRDLTAFARIWFELLSHFDIQFEEILQDQNERKEYFKLMFNLRIESLANMQIVATQMLNFAKGYFRICRQDSDIQVIFGDEACNLSEFFNLSTKNSVSIAFVLWVVSFMKVFSDETELDQYQTLEILLHQVFTFQKKQNNFDLMIATCSSVCQSLIQLGMQDERIIGIVSSQVVPELTYANQWPLELDLSELKINQLQHFNEIICFVGQFVSLIDVKDLSGKKQILIRFSKETSSEMLQIDKNPSNTEQFVVLINLKIFTDEEAKKGSIDAEKLRIQAREFVDKIQSNFQKQSGYNFKQIAFKGKCSAGVDCLLENQDEQIAMIIGELPKFDKSANKQDYQFLDVAMKDYLAKCTLEVQFEISKNLKREEVFRKTLSQYLDRPNNLNLILYQDGAQIKVCQESFMPLLSIALNQTMKFFSEHNCKELQVDYRDLLQRLSKLVETAQLPNQNLYELFFGCLQERQLLTTFQCEITDQLKDLFEEASTKFYAMRKRLNLQFQKLDLDFEPEKLGILIVFQQSSQGTSLQLTESDLKIINQSSGNFEDLQKQFNLQKKQLETIAVLTLKLD